MKNSFSLLLALFSGLVLLLAACHKKEDKATPDYAALDEATIKAYIAANPSLAAAQRQPSGLYVLITQPGTGPNAQKNQRVQVLYTGTTLDGKVFDSNLTTLGFPFYLGQGKVIAGWDEGFALLNKGAKAILLIPSGLAYGTAGSGAAIPPNSVLRFDVEVVDIK